MNKDIKSGKSHNGSTLMNEAIDELTARMERVESTLFEVTAILTEYGSIRKLFRKMDSSGSPNELRRFCRNPQLLELLLNKTIAFL